MQRIEVQNFGPIKNITLDIKDYMIFIGPQASGKSTLAKLVWLYHNFVSEISLYYSVILTQRGLKYSNYKSVLGILLPDGDDEDDSPNQYMNKDYIKSNTKIIFYYDENTYINLIDKTASNNLDKILLDIFEEYRKIKNKKNGKEISFHEISTSRSNFYNDIKNSLSEVTNIDITNIQYVPAGRMTEYYNNSDSAYIHLLHFIFGKHNDVKKRKRINNIANELENQILKGKIAIRENENKKISPNEYIPTISGKNFEVSIQQASSGQQEAMGIILVIEYLLKRKTANYTIIEEPEAHLFPEAQRDLTYLISLLANQDHNQVLLTTHSPYILAALNNLMKAYTVGQMANNANAVNDIIARELWVNPAQVFVGYMENGEISSIVNEELQQIEHDCLDSVSTDIMTKFDQLLDIQYA